MKQESVLVDNRMGEVRYNWPNGLRRGSVSHGRDDGSRDNSFRLCPRRAKVSTE